MRTSLFAVVVLCAATVSPLAFACEAPASVCSSSKAGSFPLIRSGQPAALYVDGTADSAVKLVADNFAADLQRVGGKAARRVGDARTASGDLVIIGVLGQSAVIDELVRAGKTRCRRPLRPVGSVPPASSSSARSRKCRARSSSSAPIGAAPCSVPTIFRSRSASRRGTGWPTCRSQRQAECLHHRRLAPRPAQGEIPRLLHQRRGPRPSAAGRTKKFGGINSKMYAHVFELLLRLKGNYLWPAMWGEGVQRRRSAEHDARRRDGRGHGHLAPRADDARAGRVAPQQGPGRHRRRLELRHQRRRTCASSGAAASSA